jgi:hypothetical protein
MTIAANHSQFGAAAGAAMNIGSARENRLHLRFARRAARQRGWHSTKIQFDAMRAECELFGVRPCDFRRFCALINGVHSHHCTGRRPGSLSAEPAYWPAVSRPADIGALLSSLDDDLFSGW